MAKVKLKSYIKSIHGRMGNIIFYNVNGNQYARSFTMPRNPRTMAQQQNRAAFAAAVHAWKELPQYEKSRYNRMATGRNLSGYNIFVSMRMKGIKPQGLKPVHSTVKADRATAVPVSRADTSVIYTSTCLYTAIFPPVTTAILKKPPGISAATATIPITGRSLKLAS